MLNYLDQEQLSYVKCISDIIKKDEHKYSGSILGNKDSYRNYLRKAKTVFFAEQRRVYILAYLEKRALRNTIKETGKTKKSGRI